MKTRAYAAQSATTPLTPWILDRREPGPSEVSLDILYCGVSHSDMHSVRGEWPGIPLPCVPGHEIIGRVTAVGSKVTGFRPGQIAAVGCMVDSCGVCDSCTADLEQYCDGPHGFTQTYNGSTKGGVPNTYGGYWAAITVKERRARAGSAIGGIKETQQMLDFCAENDIVADVEMIEIQDIETAYAGMLKSDVKYLCVIDMASLSA